MAGGLTCALGVMKDTVDKSSLDALLDKAEASLAVHLADRPDSKHNLLTILYSEIRAGSPRRKAYPSARDLFWDDPLDQNESQCLSDAKNVFHFIKEHA